jgi:hypothetical protein
MFVHRQEFGFSEISPMPACVSAQGGRKDEATLQRRKRTEISIMARETKKQQQERLLAEFLERLRAAPPGERVYMPVGDLFAEADVIRLDERRAARKASVPDDGANKS